MTEFIKNFDSRMENNNFEIWFEEKLYDLYVLDEVHNKYWLIQKFFEYIKCDLDIKYYVLLFIKFLWEKSKFDNNDTVNSLKSIIQNYFENGIWEYYFIEDSLETLTCISGNDSKFFKEVFQKYLDKIWKSIRLLAVFLKIFSILKINNYCFDVIVLILKNEEKSYYKFDVWKYLNELDNKEFRKYTLKLFKIFTLKNEKEHLIDLGKYVWLINFPVKSWKYLEYEFDNKKIIDRLLLKIKVILTSNNDLKIIKNFLFSDLDIISFRYQNIAKNYFDIKLFLILQEKDSDTLYQYLKQSNLSNVSFSNSEFIYDQLDTKNIWKILELYKQNVNFFFRIYLLIKEKNNKLLNIIKKNKKFYDNLILIEKQSLEEQEKRNLEEKKRWEEWKKWILYMAEINDWYYPKLLQDYYNMTNDSDDFNKFSNTEKQKLKKNVKKQALWCLNSINMTDYADERMKNIVTFEKKWEWSYSITPFIHYLYRILSISKKLKFDISEYYKEFVLLYPLVFWDESQKLFLDFLNWKIKSEDVDYILKAYSEDLHENAIWLKFYNPNWLCKFYEKFKRYFLPKQKEKLKNILLDFIETEKIRYKDEFIEKYAELVNKEEFIDIYHEPTINYFKSIISNEIPVSENDKIEFDKQLKINELLITNFKDIDAVLWRIKQIKEWIVKFNNPYALKNWEYVWRVHAISSLENELEFMWNDNRSFYHFVIIKNTVDIRDEMLELLELWLKLDQEIKLWNKESDYKSYSNYLINVFYYYVKNLDRKKKYYGQTLKLINKFPENNLNISLLRKYFWLGLNDGIIFDYNGNCFKYMKKILFLENQNKNYKYNNILLKEENNKLKSTLWLVNPKCIVFVEWLTDKIILETAYSKIYWDNNDFIIRSTWGARELWELMKYLCDDKSEFKDILIIWIFDFDNEWFHCFNKVNNTENNIIKDLRYHKFSWLIKQSNKQDNKCFLMTLPVPRNRPDLAWNLLWNLSMITIEGLFSKKVLNKFFNYEDTNVRWNINNWHEVFFKWNEVLYVPDNDCRAKNDEKKKFSKFVSILSRKSFSEFFPLFEQIKKIIKFYSSQ